jgi:hypothetical protein
MTTRLEIGLDFDGVEADNAGLKSILAKELFDKEISPDRIIKEPELSVEPLTVHEYEAIRTIVYSSRKYGFRMEPVKDSPLYIAKLMEDGHGVRTVTARKGPALEIAREWREQRGIVTPMTGVGSGVPKTEACKGLDVYVDDDWYVLEKLVGVVPNLFLYSERGYNAHIDVDPEKATRVFSWKEFYGEMERISTSQ